MYCFTFMVSVPFGPSANHSQRESEMDGLASPSWMVRLDSIVRNGFPGHLKLIGSGVKKICTMIVKNATKNNPMKRVMYSLNMYYEIFETFSEPTHV